MFWMEGEDMKTGLKMLADVYGRWQKLSDFKWFFVYVISLMIIIFIGICTHDPIEQRPVEQNKKVASAYDIGDVLHKMYGILIYDVIDEKEMKHRGAIVIPPDKANKIRRMLTTRYRQLRDDEKALYTQTILDVLKLKCPPVEKDLE